jgi:predicted metalloprotease
MVTVWPVDQHTMLVVSKAIEQHHVVKQCVLCGGPEIHSKEKPIARCFRCGNRKETETVLSRQPRRRCRRCKRYFRSRVAYLACEPCREKIAEGSVYDENSFQKPAR